MSRPRRPPQPFRKIVAFLAGEEIKTPPFTEESRKEAGDILARLQEGESVGMPQSRPMPTIAQRCHELRIGDRDHYWRIMYRIDSDAIVVIAIFPKGTKKTPLPEIQLCQRRLKKYDAD